MIRKNPCHDTMTPAGQIINRVALQNISSLQDVNGYEEWFMKYNALNGCPPITIATEAAYRAGWAAAIDNYERNKKEGW